MSYLTIIQLNWYVNNTYLLNNISFSVPKGQILGVIGANGAGKSSLLRCLYRYITPTSGKIFLNKQNIEQFSQREFAKKVAVVQQDTPPQMALTTEQLVSLGLTPHKSLFALISSKDKKHITQALEKVGLLQKRQVPFMTLSGGEKQRALIARAIVQRPEILILDEPTNHLDIHYQIEILELVRSLGITVITSIHDLNLASSMCDELLLLDKGHIISQGLPDKVITKESLWNIFNVNADVSAHPQHGKPLITYYYSHHSPTKKSQYKTNNIY